MKKISIWSYIWIGTCLRFIQDQTEGWQAKGESRLLGNIESFLDNLDDLELYVTKRAAHDLEEFRKYLEEKPEDYALTAEDAVKVSSLASDLRKTFEAETCGVFIYRVEDKRISINKLLENVDGLFAPRVFPRLPEIARYDFEEAGKCIAFTRATAAAFHVLRGTEKVVFLYYKKLIRPHKKDLTWGQMTQALSQKKKGKLPNRLIVGNLNHIKDAFRNPTQHPEKIYEIHEAQDLFSLCIDAVNRIMKELS